MFKICPKVTIDLSAIQENYISISRFIGNKSITSAVVKNDAYGLGAQRVAISLYEVGCRDFWVAYLKEAIDIRRVLPFDANIYFFQGVSKSDVSSIKTYRITPVINSINEFYEVKDNDIEMVLHIDTGLTRLGFRDHDIDIILNSLKSENIKYVISHLACSFDKNHPLNLKQKTEFDKILNKIRGFVDVKAGLSASDGVLLDDESYYYDIVRIGAFLYGIKPQNNINFQKDNISQDQIISKNFKIKPKNVFSLKAKVLQKYNIDPKTSIGYSSTFISNKKMKIAIVSIGYADGIKRSLSNRGSVLFYDELNNIYRANILGSISMDLIACDITDIPEKIIDRMIDAVILDSNYSINEMANDANTIAYEILTSINFKSKRFDIDYIA